MLSKKIKIATIGQGYVGLPLSLLLCKNNYNIHAYDIDENLIKKLGNGLYGNLNENDLDVIELYKSTKNNKNITFSSNLDEADIYIVCVPTPIKENHKPDIDFVFSAIYEILNFLKDDDLIIIESTISINSIKKIQKIIKAKKKKINYSLAYCPERVLPGNALNEIIRNDRIIGGINKKSALYAKDLYKIFVKGQIYLTTIEIAEFTKLVENSFRDVNIAFANEVSILCEKYNVSYRKVIDLANKHPRVNILNPSIGVGGHCIPIDPWFLIENYKKKISLIRNARLVNKDKTKIVTKKIISKYNSSNVCKKNILILGLSYKANIADLRESPAIEIVRDLQRHLPANFYINDPHLTNFKIQNTKFCSLSKGLKLSKFVVILVGHDAYLDIHRKITKSHVIIDESGIFPE